MNVLFFYPNIDAQIGFNYGLASIAAVLENHGHRTRLVNLNEKLAPLPSDAEIFRTIDEFNPGLIGFSIVTNQWRHARELAAKVKSHTGVPIVAGGIHVSMVPETVLEGGAFDFACVGEGEDAVLELVEALASGRDATRIRNVWTRADGRVIANPVRPLRDLANLPPMHYDLFDFQALTDAKQGWVGVMSSRGCPFRCTYCFNHRIVDLYRRDTGLSLAELNYVRRLSPERMVSEMADLASRCRRVRMFIFDDDLFTADNDYLRRFSTLYRERLNVPFVCNAHVRAFDEETARLLAEAGCRIVKFGLESGSERVRSEIMRRPMTNDEIRRAFAAAHKLGLHTSAFVMFGLPTETREEMLETVRLLAEIHPGRFRWAIFFPYPNTDACDLALKAGLIDRGKMESLSNFTTDTCLKFPPEVERFMGRLNRAYSWYVNALAPGEVGAIYRGLVQTVESAADALWPQMESTLHALDRRLSDRLAAAGVEHYGIRYEKFMGVSSSYFTRPDA